MIQAIASYSHYFDHILPIYIKLKARNRGRFYVHSRAEDHARAKMPEALRANLSVFENSLVLLSKLKKDAPVIVAGYSDMIIANKRNEKIIYMEHGVGLTYLEKNVALCDSSDRQGVDLILSPNVRAYRLSRKANPNIKNHIVGIPFMDSLASITPNGLSVVCFSFHFDAGVNNFLRGSFKEYRRAVLDVYRASRNFDVLIHAHPRAQAEVFTWMKNHGVSEEHMIEHFDDVVRKADLYVCDNSSTVFMFASTGKRVLFMNRASWQESYHRKDKINFRFWEYSDIGMNIFDGCNLHSEIEKELACHFDIRRHRKRELKKEIFPAMGRSASRASKVIERIYEN